MQPPPTSNCQEDNTRFMEIPQQNLPPQASSSSSSEGGESAIIESDVSSDYEDLEDEPGIFYFAGYLCYKLQGKFKCTECQQKTMSYRKETLTDEKHLLLLHKTYNIESSFELKCPTKETAQIVATSLQVYKKLIKNHLYDIGIKKLLKNQIYKRIDPKNVCSNEKHYKYFFDVLLNTLIFKECQWKKTSSTKKAKAKLKILRNE